MSEKSTGKAVEKQRYLPLTTYQAGVMQATTHRVLQKYCDDVLSVYSITKTQWLIIGTVLDAGTAGIRITDLSEKVGTTLSYLTNTINLLESKNIVTRVNRGEDSRAKYVSIVESYISTCDKIEKHLRDALRKSVYADISREDFYIYMKVMKQLSNISTPR